MSSMHVHDMGTAADLAGRIRPAAALLGTPAAPDREAAATPSRLSVSRWNIAEIVFLQYFGKGEATALATRVRAAIDGLGKRPSLARE